MNKTQFLQINSHIQTLARTTPLPPSAEVYNWAKKDYVKYFLWLLSTLDIELGGNFTKLEAAITKSDWNKVLLLSPTKTKKESPTKYEKPDLSIEKLSDNYETLTFPDGKFYDFLICNEDQVPGDFLKIPYFNTFRNKKKFPYFLAATTIALNPCLSPTIIQQYYFLKLMSAKNKYDYNQLRRIWQEVSLTTFIRQDTPSEKQQLKYLHIVKRQRRRGTTLSVINQIMAEQPIYNLMELHAELERRAYPIELSYLRKLNGKYRFVDKGKIIAELQDLSPVQIHERTGYSFATIKIHSKSSDI